ncbi:MAG: nuclear transport factor 2 family protein [Bryobacteraceae bacterium]
MRILLLLCLTLSLRAGDREDILAVVQTTFDGMASADAAKIKATMTPEARVLLMAGEKVLMNATAEEFATRVTTRKEGVKIEEKIYAPKVDISAGVASVWAEYDFFSNGAVGHCGIDAFLLQKTAAGWKIFSIASTVEKQGCPAR